MSEPKVLNAPDRIYLQAGELIDDVLFGEMAEVTWCQDPVGDHDVPYVRADLHAALEAEVERLKARERELEADPRLALTYDDLEWAAKRAAHLAILAVVSAEEKKEKQ